MTQETYVETFPHYSDVIENNIFTRLPQKGKRNLIPRICELLSLFRKREPFN